MSLSRQPVSSPFASAPSRAREIVIGIVVWTGLWSTVGWLYGYHVHTHAWQAAGIIGTLFGLFGGLTFGLLTMVWSIKRGPPGMALTVGLGAIAAELAVIPVIYLASRTLLLPLFESSVVLGMGAVTGMLAFLIKRWTARVRVGA